MSLENKLYFSCEHLKWCPAKQTCSNYDVLGPLCISPLNVASEANCKHMEYSPREQQRDFCKKDVCMSRASWLSDIKCYLCAKPARGYIKIVMYSKAGKP